MTQLVLPTDLTFDEAHESVEITKRDLASAADQIVRQINGRAWLAFGLDSWDEMREKVYNGVAVMVPRADRPELVARLRQEGLSQREIGDTIGVSHQSVGRDLRNVQTDNTEQPPTRTDALGRERPTTYTPRAQDELPDPHAAGPVEDLDAPAPSAARPSPDALARHERERAAQVSRQTATDNLAKSVWLIAGQAEMDEPVDRIITDWLPEHDIYPKPTTAERLKTAADYLFALSERWPW